MKIKFFILPFLFIIYTCDHQLIAPVRDNPFDSESELTSGDPFNLQTQNLSDHIRISWEYTYGKPALESFLLYRINSFSVDILYTGTATTFSDTTVEWDSTYTYYVTAMINEKETSPPEIDNLTEVKRRIVVGEDEEYTTIGDALDIVMNGNIIYVKDGTYKENIDYKGKAITLRSENGPENTIIAGSGDGVVVTMDTSEDENSILYGFTIRNGIDNKGGGIHIDDSSPIIRNCIIENNTASKKGGGMYLNRSFSLIDSCIIRNNSAKTGGGIFITDERGDPIFQNCEFTGNTSIMENYNIKNEGDGGGVFVDTGNATFIHCLFHNNQAEDDGGGIYLYKANSVYVAYGSFFSNNSVDKGGAIYFEQKSENSTIINSIFSGNYGKNGGGAIYSKHATPTINYTTFWNNNVDIEEGSNGGGIYCEDGSAMTIINSILWDNAGNTHPEIYFESIVGDTLFTIEYSDIEGGFTGDGNLNTDPVFEDTDNGNFHLQENSPCIGTTSTPDSNDQMGAYGGENGDGEGKI